MRGEFKITDEVRSVLEKSQMTATMVKLPPEQLPRGLYTAVNKVLEGAGGKWDRKSGTHLFKNDPRAALGRAVETGTALNEKKAFQSFYTPLSLARRVVELAEVGTGMTVLEPSAGEGALLDALFESKKRWCAEYAVELNPQAVEVLIKKGYLTWPGDFLELVPEPSYDRVIMNPPFANQQDIDHVTHAFKFLKPSGILVAIMAPSVRTTAKAKAFRKLLLDNISTRCDVEAGTFSESGTEISTVIVKIMKATNELVKRRTT